MKSRTSRRAEKHFSVACSSGGAVASEPDEDTNGWDFFVEFPDMAFTGPAETKPPRPHAFVQIKSTVSRSMIVKVKLSNMLTACSSPDPWFLILVDANNEMYGLEICGALMHSALKDIRKARLAGKKLNRTFQSVRFRVADRICENVVDWMQARIGSSIEAYRTAKSRLYSATGYERGFAVVNFSITSPSDDEIGNAFLGLGSGLNIEHFSVTDQRFGIPEPLGPPIPRGTMSIKPTPISTCEIRVVSPTNEPSLALKGNVYGFHPPLASRDSSRLRLCAPPVDIVLHRTGGEGTLTLKANESYNLAHFAAYTKIMRWLRAGPLKVDARTNGNPTWSGNFEANSNGREIDCLIDIVSALTKVAQHSALSNFEFSLADVNNGLPLLHSGALLLGDRALKIEVPTEDFSQQPATSIIFPVALTIGDWEVGAIVERAVVTDQTSEGLRTLVCGPAQVREAKVCDRGAVSMRIDLESDYQRILSNADKLGRPLGIEGMMTWLEKT
ncbi:hypothetical protein [Ciceribacter sp. T2.26MG-112.2]|uniref:hypothetical protein n=1 Tax=Ciceribacter sp. T2.26MG-112.2 TaxID=3137154 RepID=UPI0012B6A6BD|nr:hypothetical protein [Ciceribacter naphthalenivorans]